MRKVKKLKLNSLVAIARPEAIYICNVIRIDKEIQGRHFDYYFIDELSPTKGEGSEYGKTYS